jgi:hypothetical protein
MEDAVGVVGPGLVLSKLPNDRFAFLLLGGSMLWASVLSEGVPS